MKEKILIVEDQFVEANSLQLILERAGYQVCGIARSVSAALDVMDRERPTMVLLDIFLQGPLTGIDLARTLREKNIPFIYLSANSDDETLEAAKATHPYGFLVKPFRKKDVLVMLEIASYLHENSLEAVQRKESDATSNEPVASEKPISKNEGQPNFDFHGIIGGSKKLQSVLNHLQIVAPTDTSVLILGESGTGKERVAEVIHKLSARRSGPLIKVNCAALPPNLIESELFGHERGSFTGATDKRIGKFEQAKDGTIFLDEIGEIPPDIQMKLLRVLQEKEIERVGGNATLKVNVRIVAATNRNLEKEVSQGRFRMDLYYRLNVFPLVLPPLRERKDDIDILSRHFISVYARKLGKKISGISEQVIGNLTAHDWPGNIRELEHTIERAVLLTSGSTIEEITLPKIPAQTAADTRSIKTIHENEREHILSALRKSHGKISGEGGAAELLGIPYSTLNSRIKKLGITKAHIFSSQS